MSVTISLPLRNSLHIVHSVALLASVAMTAFRYRAYDEESTIMPCNMNYDTFYPTPRTCYEIYCDIPLYRLQLLGRVAAVVSHYTGDIPLPATFVMEAHP